MSPIEITTTPLRGHCHLAKRLLAVRATDP